MGFRETEGRCAARGRHDALAWLSRQAERPRLRQQRGRWLRFGRAPHFFFCLLECYLLAKFTLQLRRRRRRRAARVAMPIIAPSRGAPPENSTQNKGTNAHRGARQMCAVADIILRVDEPPLVREVKYR